MKKVLSIVLSLVMVLCMVPTMAFADTAVYSDIAGTKCEASVELLKELGVVDGYEDGTYQPEGTVTRAEMAKLIVTQLGLNPTSSTTAFTDMAGASWAIPYVGYAESLGIIKGYGDGTFGPNDPVSYDAVVTMIVRAIGYTEACNEMQGQWPAVFVQKANELGILKNIATTGNGGANRGDVAIMLANALDVQMVYADNEGATVPRNDADGFAVTMYSTLVKEGGKYYGVVTADDIAGAAKNINELLGAAGQIVYNEDYDVISVSDLKSTFMTGKFNEAGTVFTTDGKDYTVGTSALKDLYWNNGKVFNTDSVPTFNNAATGTTVGAIKSIGTGTVTIAGNVKGSTLTEIFSVQYWTADKQEQISDAQITQIEKNKKLLGVEFKKDVDGNINNDSFILAGVDSLEDIEEDYIVYVYMNPTTEKISKIEVGTEVVSGEITKAYIADDYKDSYIYIDDVKYAFATDAADSDTTVLAAGNDVTLYLDYSGKIFESKLTDGTSGNYAVVIDATENNYEGSTFDKDTKVQLLTADGVKTFVVNIKKVNKDSDVYASAIHDGSDAIFNNVIKYSLDSDGKIKSITDIGEVPGEAASEEATKVTAKGYLDGRPIAEGAVIFAAPVDGTDFETTPDTDDLSVLTKEDVLGKTVGEVYTYYVNEKTGAIDCLIVANTATSADLYGVIAAAWNTADGIGADYYVNGELVEGIEVENDEVTPGAILYKITNNADGSVTFDFAADANYVAKVEKSEDAAIDTQIDLSKNKVVISDGDPIYLADDVIVYIWDKSAKTFDVDGSSVDIIDSKNLEVKLYATATKADDANNGLVTVVVITRP